MSRSTALVVELMLARSSCGRAVEEILIGPFSTVVRRDLRREPPTERCWRRDTFWPARLARKKAYGRRYLAMSGSATDAVPSGERYFYVHVQKTGGTELQRRLQHHFGAKAIYPDGSDGTNPDSVLQVANLVERWKARREEIAVVTGHFPLCTTEVLGEKFRTFTTLRDPVERTLSFLRHHKRAIVADQQASFEEVYGHPVRFHGLIHNHMVKMFSLRPEEMDAGAMTFVAFTDEHLERAKEGLATVDVVGIQEQFEDFYDELVRRFGFADDERLNANSTRRVEVSQSFRDRIAEDNALDVEFYAFAQKLVASRGPA